MLKLNELSPIQVLALARAAAKIETETGARDAVEPMKDARVTFSVKVDTLLTVAPDTVAVVAAAVPVWKLLAAAFGRLSPDTVKSIVENVDSIVSDGDEKSFKKQVTDAFDMLKAKTEAPRRGAVKVSIVP